MPDESTYGFNIHDATALAAMIGSGESELPEYRRAGGRLQWFVLAEDITSTTDAEVYVWPATFYSGVTPTAVTTGEPIILTNAGYCLSPTGKLARSGYYGTMENVGGKWVPISTYECLTACTPSGGSSITQPTFTDATVGVSYSFTISTTGTVTSVACSNLPAGLSFNSGTLQITGTPTTAGHKWVTITGTSGTCTITKLSKLNTRSENNLVYLVFRWITSTSQIVFARQKAESR